MFDLTVKRIAGRNRENEIKSGSFVQARRHGNPDLGKRRRRKDGVEGGIGGKIRNKGPRNFQYRETWQIRMHYNNAMYSKAIIDTRVGHKNINSVSSWIL